MSLKIYAVILELVRRMAPRLSEVKLHSAALRDQLERALLSVPLNVLEGSYSRGRNRQARYQNAAASAREALASHTARVNHWRRLASARGSPVCS